MHRSPILQRNVYFHQWSEFYRDRKEGPRRVPQALPIAERMRMDMPVSDEEPKLGRRWQQRQHFNRIAFALEKIRVPKQSPLLIGEDVQGVLRVQVSQCLSVRFLGVRGIRYGPTKGPLFKPYTQGDVSHIGPRYTTRNSTNNSESEILATQLRASRNSARNVLKNIREVPEQIIALMTSHLNYFLQVEDLPRYRRT